jgi:hypothetical protein
MNTAQTFRRTELEAKLRERMIKEEHEAALAERRRRDTLELAGTLGNRCRISCEEMLEKLSGREAERWKIASTLSMPTREPGSSHYERVQNSWEPCRLVGPEEADPEDAYEAATLAEVLGSYLDQKERVRINAGASDFSGPLSDGVHARERERLEEARKARDEQVSETLTERVVNGLGHCGFSDAELRLIRKTLDSGNERAIEELLIVRRGVTGPSGGSEPAWSLHAWDAEHGRPNEQELGAGSKVRNLRELRDEVRERELIFERYGGQHAVAAWPALREPAI